MSLVVRQINSTQASRSRIDIMRLHIYNQHTDMMTRGQTGSDDDDDDEGRINFSVALSPKTTRTRNNKLKQ